MKKSLRDAVKIDSLEVEGLGKVTTGLKVIHPVFGAGTVVALFEFPPYCEMRHAIGVQFETAGYRSLAPEYAKLELAKA